MPQRADIHIVRRTEQPREDWIVLELFAGTGGFTAACKRAGFRVGPAFELKSGLQYNLAMRVVQLSILSQIRSGRVRHVHLGTPCSVWSLARRGIQDRAKARQKEIFGVEFALFSAVATECSRCGIGFSIENPRGSRLWQFPPIAATLALPGVRMIELHICVHSERDTRSLHTFAQACPSSMS